MELLKVFVFKKKKKAYEAVSSTCLQRCYCTAFLLKKIIIIIDVNYHIKLNSSR